MDDLMDRNESDRFLELRKKLFPKECQKSQAVYGTTKIKYDGILNIWVPRNRCPFLVCRLKQQNLDRVRLYRTRQRFF